MKYLIDTHILLWYMVGDRRITRGTRKIIEDDKNVLFLSNVSLWEITIKESIGKLILKGSLKDLKNFLDEKGIKIIEFDIDDLEKLQSLPFHHQDPFDRLIVSQAMTKSLEIITNDKQVEIYFE